MANDGPPQDSNKAICITCACHVLESLRDAALSCDMAPLGALLQQSLEEAQKQQREAAQKGCECKSSDGALADEIMHQAEARQLLEFVSAVAMLGEEERAHLAEELEEAQRNNLLDNIH